MNANNDKDVKKNRSLTVRMTRTLVVSCLVLGLGTLILSLGLYGTTLIRQCIDQSFELAEHVASSVTMGADSIPLSKDIMDAYRDLSDEERAKAGSEEYRAYFKELFVADGEDGAWNTLLHMLRSFTIDVDDVYLAMIDEDTSAMVYIVDSDPDEETVFYPGEWESLSRREILKIKNWNGEGKLYDIDITDEYGWLCTAAYPVMDSEGIIREYVFVDISIENLVHRMAAYSLQISLCIAVLSAVLAFFLTGKTRKDVVEPINKITEASLRYVSDKKEGVTGTGYFQELDINTGDELENLSKVMSGMERDLSDYEENIARYAAEKERLSTELHMAEKIQSSMLPHDFPPFPERKEFDVYASMDPARDVGGDFYDFFLIDDDHLGIVMADVSGKGIPAALLMMASKIILQNLAMMGLPPAKILYRANKAICSRNQTQMFVTVWFGILEISTGIIRAANAGHEYPAIMKEGRYELLKDKHGFVLGGLEGSEYKEYEIRLEPGDRIFLYTDGVPEATAADKELFGTERMLKALNRKTDVGLKETLDNVREAVDDFVKDAEQFDDLTMLVLEYHRRSE